MQNDVQNEQLWTDLGRTWAARGFKQVEMRVMTLWNNQMQDMFGEFCDHKGSWTMDEVYLQI